MLNYFHLFKDCVLAIQIQLFVFKGFGQGNSEWDDLPTDDVDIPPHPSDYENLYAKAKGTAGKVRVALLLFIYSLFAGSLR